MAMWHCGIVAFSGLHKKSPPKLRRGSLLPSGGREGLVLTQIVHDAADLARREDALATSVAELPELFLEGLADINPMLQFLPR